MKVLISYFSRTKWHWLILAALLLPSFAHAAVKSGKRAVQEACELQVQSEFKKKAVEVGMAAIAGNLNDLEASREREGLEASLEKKRAGCKDLAGEQHDLAHSDSNSF